MDLNALREMAIEAASRALYEKDGFVPSEESDEWEEEYRRQFAALKQRYGSQVTVPSRPAAASTPQRQLPELSGTPEQLRWAASIRDERLREPWRRPIATDPSPRPSGTATHRRTRSDVEACRTGTPDEWPGSGAGACEPASRGPWSSEQPDPIG